MSTPQMMRAAVMVRPGRVELQQLPRPEPGPGQVRVRLEGSGVCASSLPLYEGRVWFTYPQEPGKPGHEGWGVVDALGAGVRDVRVGQRVAALSYAAFAEYDLAAADAVVPLPRALDGQPFPGEALACAMNIWRRAEIERGQSVAILGIGFLGALLTRLASRAGARVLAVSRRTSSRELAVRLGAQTTLSFGEVHDVVREARRWANAEGLDRVIEAVGEQRALDLATELVGVRGRLVIAGYHQDGPRQVNLQLWNWRGIDVVNAHERDPAMYVRGMREAVDLVASRHLDPMPLYTHILPLSELAAALAHQHHRPEGFVKALVRIPA